MEIIKAWELNNSIVGIILDLSFIDHYAGILAEDPTWEDILKTHAETKSQYAELKRIKDEASEAITDAMDSIKEGDVMTRYAEIESAFKKSLKDLTKEVLQKHAPNLFLTDPRYPKKLT